MRDDSEPRGEKPDDKIDRRIRMRSRDEELCGLASVRKQILETMDDVEAGFRDQRDRCDQQLDYWDLYFCSLGPNQYYSGNSRIFVPIVHSALNAIKTRFVNQIFPRTGRYVEVVTENGDLPHAQTALLEYYVGKAMLRTSVAMPLVVAGYVEGQYNVYVAWSSKARHVVWKERKAPEFEGVAVPELGEFDDIEEEEQLDEHPIVEVLSDVDVLILPTSVDSVEEALEIGGSGTIIRRWSKTKIRELIRSGDIGKPEGQDLMKAMSDAGRGNSEDVKKKFADVAGIQSQGKQAVIYETWRKLKIDGKYRLCRSYFAGDKRILSTKLNPYWSDLCPLISYPVNKLPGVIKGMSMLQPVAELQYAANDAVNEGMDSAAYSLLPIVMTDPAQNPRIGTMILDQAAIWETNPSSTQFAKFPDIWKDAFQIVASAKQEIFQTLSVNPSMMPQQTGSKGSKRNQAEIANEQQVDILTTAEAVSVLEEQIFTPIITRFAAYDAQFRSAEMTVRSFGAMGRRVEMERVPPIQWGKRYQFRWLGVETARNAAQIQQQISLINVFRGIPKDLMPGRQLDITPLADALAENAFGPRIAPLVFKDLRMQISIDPEEENGLLSAGFDLGVSPFDDDAKHMAVHGELLAAGDQTGSVRGHMLKHQQSMQQKQQQQVQQQGSPGTPGGGQPGVPGVPPSGAQVGGPHAPKGPPGMIRPDSMPAAGAATMPRRG